MTKLTFSSQLSLDGFMEGPGGAMDWFAPDDPWEWERQFRTLESVDAVLMGRGMYSGYTGYWSAVLAEPGRYSADELRYARWAERTPHLLFSRTMKRADWGSTTVVAGELKDEVRALKANPGKGLIVFGGASFARALIDAGLVDEYYFVVNPVLLGGGKSPFHGLSRRRLKLEQAETSAHGTVLLRYVNAEEER